MLTDVKLSDIIKQVGVRDSCWACSKALRESNVCHYCGADQKRDVSTDKPADYAERMRAVDELVREIGREVKAAKAAKGNNG